ncbi:putative ankyrin repeat protein RF_0381 [Saccostrea cucullata]|uniref:putative ankyrin repeat protein RF_0381 n=1 Tax=Saccostrea cuccullata TaxID=36930 RepID=UPI002ED39343
MCKYLINKHPDLLNVIDNDGYTVLHDAAYGGNIDVFKLLIDKGLEVENTTFESRSVLHFSCMNGKLTMSKFLLSNYPHLLNMKNIYNENELFDAAWGGNVELFKLLIDRGLDINCSSRYGKSMLHWSCRNGKIEMSRYLVSNYPNLLGALDNDGMNVLHDAAFGGNVKLFEFLIDKGLDVNSRANNGKTVLHWCCRNGKQTMFTYLNNKYSHFLHLKDDNDENVLHDAAWGGNVNLLKMVIEEGFDVDSKTKKGKTVLHQSCRNGKLAMCKYLFQIHPELVKCIDNDGGNLLHDAAWGGQVEVFKFVLEKGLDVYSKTKKGKTVLHQSCMNGKVHMCKYLINHYPDLLEHTDNEGESVLHDAAFGGNIYLLNFLIDKGLDVNRKTNKGKTVLHKCCINGKVQMCEYLVSHQPQLLTVQDNDGVNALHDTAIGGEVELFKFLLEKGLDVHSKTGTGQTVLHLSCHVGKHVGSHVDKQAMFDYLIDSYPDLLDVVDNEGNTVLHVACVQNQTKICSSLVEKFPDLLNIENKNGEKIVVCFVNGEKQFKMASEQ